MTRKIIFLGLYQLKYLPRLENWRKPVKTRVLKNKSNGGVKIKVISVP